MSLKDQVMMEDSLSKGFFNLITIAILGQIFLCCEEHFRTFSSAPGLYPLDASSNSPCLSCDNQNCPQILPNVLSKAKSLFGNHQTTAESGEIGRWGFCTRKCSAVSLFKITLTPQVVMVIFWTSVYWSIAAFIGWSFFLLKNVFVHLASKKPHSWFSSVLAGLSTQIPFLISSFSWPLNIRITHRLCPGNSSLFTHFLGDLMQSHDFSKTFICFPHLYLQI